MDSIVQTFRASLSRLLLGAAFFHGLLTLLVIGFVILAGRQIIWLYTALFAFIPMQYWIVYGLTFRLVVSREGLKWTTLEGATMFASWNEIEGASRDHFPFLSAIGIVVAGERDRSFLLLVLSEPREFEEALREFAGADHPLTRAVIG